MLDAVFVRIIAVQLLVSFWLRNKTEDKEIRRVNSMLFRSKTRWREPASLSLFAFRARCTKYRKRLPQHPDAVASLLLQRDAAAVVKHASINREAKFPLNIPPLRNQVSAISRSICHLFESDGSSIFWEFDISFVFSFAREIRDEQRASVVIFLCFLPPPLPAFFASCFVCPLSFSFFLFLSSENEFRTQLRWNWRWMRHEEGVTTGAMIFYRGFVELFWRAFAARLFLISLEFRYNFLFKMHNGLPAWILQRNFRAWYCKNIAGWSSWKFKSYIFKELSNRRNFYISILINMMHFVISFKTCT